MKRTNTKKSLTIEDIQNVKKLIRDNYRTSEISEILKISSSTCSYLVRAINGNHHAMSRLPFEYAKVVKEFLLISNNTKQIDESFNDEIKKNDSELVLTRREYFTGLAMQGYLSQGSWSSKVLLVESSIKIADELLKQLES